MSRRIIPVADVSAVPVITGPVQTPSGVLRDTLSRPLRDLRISVTDRCNFRCVYCMPKEVFGRDYRFLPRRELLTFEEIERVARVFVGLGVHKLRITGGHDAHSEREWICVEDMGLAATTLVELARVWAER